MADQGSDRSGLAGAGLAVQQDQLAGVRWLLHPKQRVQRLSHWALGNCVGCRPRAER